MEGMLIYWSVNHISLAGIDDLYWRERHDEILYEARRVTRAMSCSSIRRYFLRNLGIEWQADGRPAIVNTIFFKFSHLFDVQFIRVCYHILHLLGGCSQSATLVGCTYTVVAIAIVVEIDLVLYRILLVDPFACFLILFEKEVAECLRHRFPLQEVVVDGDFIFPYDMVLRFGLFFFYLFFAAFI